MYTVGHLRSKGSRKIFPIKAADGKDCFPTSLIGHKNGYRRNTQVYSPEGITEALDTCSGGGREPHVAMNVSLQGIGGYGNQQLSNGERLQGNRQSGDDGCYCEMFGIDYNIGGKERDIANTIKARYDAGVTRFKQDGTAVCVRIKPE